MREKIYKQLLHFGIIHLRNFFDAPQGDPGRFESARCVAQLLHYIPPLLMNSVTGQGDVYFLEVGAREFLQQYPSKTETHFLQTADLLLELHQSIKEQTGIAWAFPSGVEAEVRRFRQMSVRPS
jgi:hypothetical protein